MSDPVLLLLGDCVERMRELDDASVDAICTDPPYLIGFMGKEFDSQHKSFVERRSRRRAGSFEAEHGNHNPTNSADAARTRRSENQRAQAWHERWAVEALRVLKPGGHLLAFGGTRTYHRLAAGLEDAGFEIRDCVAWIYGSGFPKSLDVSRAIDESLGRSAERERAGLRVYGDGQTYEGGERSGRTGGGIMGDSAPRGPSVETRAASPQAATWDGWGTALKPAFELIVVARKPLAGTVAANVLAYGTGALNVDGCRVAFVSDEDEDEAKAKNRHGDFGTEQGGNEVYGDYTMLDPRENYDPPGRWPANIALGHAEDCVLVGTREVASDGHYPSARPGGVEIGTVGHAGQDGLVERHTRGERQEVWECVPGCPIAELDRQSGESFSSGGQIGKRDSGLDAVYGGGWDSAAKGDPGYGDAGVASRFFYCAKTSRSERNAGLEAPIADVESGPARNLHPTVKPIALMRWLVRLVTPPGGLVLDPFLGSGTTAVAAILEGLDIVGIEREPDYLAIAEARVAFWTEYGEEGLRVCAERDAAGRERRRREEAGQLDLFGAA